MRWANNVITTKIAAGILAADSAKKNLHTTLPKQKYDMTTSLFNCI